MSRPVILLNCNYDLKGAFRPYVNATYTRAVRLAGGLPLLLPYQAHDQDIDIVLETGSALMMTGGADVDPVHYGEAKHVKTVLKYEEAQRFDLELVRRAQARGMPMLAICLGAQQVNVACGGTLYQDLTEQVSTRTRHHRDNEEQERPTHRVRVEEGSLLARIVQTPEMVVNTSHHQAMRSVGTGLKVSARSVDDDLIEAVEDPGLDFFLAVQWHPEEMCDPGTLNFRLFEALVRAAEVFARAR